MKTYFSIIAEHTHRRMMNPKEHILCEVLYLIFGWLLHKSWMMVVWRGSTLWWRHISFSMTDSLTDIASLNPKDDRAKLTLILCEVLNLIFELNDGCLKKIHFTLKTYGWHFWGRTEHGNYVIFFVFLATVFGNLEVWKVKKWNIFLKYISAAV